MSYTIGRNATFTLLSTGITGITTMGAALAVQFASGTADLGAWSLSAAPLAAALAIQRALLSQSILRGALVKTVPGLQRWLRVLSVGSTIVAFVVVLLYDLPVILQLVAVVTPLALLQDLYRFRQFGLNRPIRAAASDSIWLGGFALAVIVLSQFWALSLTLVCVAYGVGIGLSIFFSLVTWPTETTYAGARFPSTGHLFAESTSIFVLGNLSQFVVGALLSLNVVGQFRLAMTAAQPVTFAGSFCSSFLVPRMNPFDKRSTARATAYAFSLCVLVGLAPIVVLVALPRGLLDAANIYEFTAVLLPTALLAMGFALGGAAQIWLFRVRLTVPARFWLAIRITASLFESAVTICAGYVWGAVGLSLGPLTNNGFCGLAFIFRRYQLRRGCKEAWWSNPEEPQQQSSLTAESDWRP